MDISTEKDRTVIDQPASVQTTANAVPGIFRWLIRLLTLTKEELSKAGIFVGSEDHGE